MPLSLPLQLGACHPVHLPAPPHLRHQAQRAGRRLAPGRGRLRLQLPAHWAAGERAQRGAGRAFFWNVGGGSCFSISHRPLRAAAPALHPHCLLQARLKFTATPATRFRPPSAELSAEVGQMLVYVRIKHQASMTAFATQLAQISSVLGNGGDKEAPPKRPAQPAAAAEQAAQQQASYRPKLQPGLKVGPRWLLISSCIVSTFAYAPHLQCCNVPHHIVCVRCCRSP